MSKLYPKILYFDIETLPLTCFTWGLGKQYVGYENIQKERKIACICYKWDYEDTIHALTMDFDLHNPGSIDDKADKEMLVQFSKVYGYADIAIAHNGINFDKAVIRSRLVKHQLPDISPVIIDDTYINSKLIGFTSHKLDYIARYLGIGKKESHPYSLWVDVSKGSKKAMREMVKYCKKDVLILSKVYTWLKPYIKTKLNLAAFHNNKRMCPWCGEIGCLVVDNNRRRITLGLRTTMRCKKCLKYSTTGSKSPAGTSQLPRSV